MYAYPHANSGRSKYTFRYETTNYIANVTAKGTEARDEANMIHRYSTMESHHLAHLDKDIDIASAFRQLSLKFIEGT